LLVRHGQTDWNALGLAQGHTNTELNAVGRKQARAIAKALEPIKIDRIRCSDLTRCVQTAESIAAERNLEIETYQELRERAFGDREGKAYQETLQLIKQDAEKHGADPLSHRFAGGESGEDLYQRVADFLKRIADPQGTTLIVGHGGAGACVLAHLLGGGLTTVRAFALHNARVTTLRHLDGPHWRLVGYNEREPEPLV
jgi:probable phosphoglycerate mutase